MVVRFDHEFTTTNLSAYLDGQLSPRDIQRIEQHLATCDTCREDLRTLRATVALLHHVPLRPVPRSFTLPLSMQGVPVRLRRWDTAYSALRLSAMVVSFMLVLLVAGDLVLSRMRVIPMTSPPASNERQVSRSAPPAPTLLAQGDAQPQQPVTSDSSAGVAALQPTTNVSKREPQATLVRAATAPLVAAAVPPTQAAGPGAPAGAKAAALAPAGTQAPSLPQVFSASPAAQGGAMLNATPTRESAEPAHSPSAPQMRATSLEATAPTALAERLVASTLPPSPMPEMRASATPAHVARQVSNESPTISAPIVSRPFLAAWTLGRAVRIAWTLLAGVLLILLAGVIWAGSKRRA
jgi:anti-sigma factor RsiW